MSEALNPHLYRRLKRHFGRVRIAHNGHAAKYVGIRDVVDDSPKLAFTHTGEYYQVCCPYCNDTRFRLYINHLYGKRDTFGRRMSFLAVCYNETACMSKEQNSRDLYETLSEMDGVLEECRIKEGKEVSEEAREISLPGPCKLLSELKPDHKARLYLQDRNLDPDYLAEKFGVMYCIDSHYFLARDRILVPVYDRDKLKGWQTRYIGELPWKDKTKKKDLPPKWFTYPGMPRRLLIYNFDRAREYETGVIVEGCGDVWGVGMPGMATFGSSMSYQQMKRILAVFRKRKLVLLYDPEEFNTAATKRLREKFARQLAGNFVAVKLPSGTDPGSLERDFLRDYMKEKAAKKGLTLSFRKIKK